LSIKTLEEAKAYFIQMGCSNFHIDREDPVKREEYRSLKISREKEAEWRKEQFQIGLEVIMNCDSKEIAGTYSTLKSLMAKDRKSLKSMLNILDTLVNKIPVGGIHEMLNCIIGNNGYITHGGMIEIAFEIHSNNLAYRLIEYSKKLIDMADSNQVPILSKRGYLVDILNHYRVKEDNNYIERLTEKNDAELFDYYFDGAKNGNIYSMRMLAKHYYNGKGCEKDNEQALHWAKKAAELGNDLALKEYKEIFERITGESSEV